MTISTNSDELDAIRSQLQEKIGLLEADMKERDSALLKEVDERLKASVVELEQAMMRLEMFECGDDDEPAEH